MATTVVTKTQSKRGLSETIKNYWLDIFLFFAFIIDMNTHFTGIPIHEWLGIGFGIALIYHLMLHWQWITAVTQRLFKKLPAQQRFRYLIDLLLFINMVIVIVTGLWISEVAMAQLGLQAQQGFMWRRLHHSSSELVIFLVGLHLALDWKWIVAHTKRYITTPLAKLAGRKTA
ncbi:MAG: cytochrome b/b6 domain-containing protein [Anaerolineales bacterium]|nr:cytochrome b/b6 domain-containing protein [Anaerolineales bacterium]